VKQLDSTTRQSAGNRIFKIRAGDAKKISDVINRTFVTIDSQGKTRPRLNVAADEISNLLIVAGTPEDIQAVGMVVEQLDVGNPFQPKDLKVIELPHAEGEKLAQLAGRVWGSQMRGVEGNGDVTFIHEPSGKRLIIVSPTELMTRAEQIVNGLLVSPESSSREVAVIELEHGNASELVPVLSSAYEAKVAGLPGIPASILSGANSKQVVVMGTPQQIIEIRGMASELDAPVETIQKVTESFRLSSADEVDVVSTMVKQIYESRHEGLASDPADAAFLSDAGNRRLIVVAKPDHIEEIKQLVKQVQVVGTDRTARQSKSLALAHIKGAEAMTVLSQVFSVEMAATEPARKLILTPSPDGGSLFMDAPEDDAGGFGSARGEGGAFGEVDQGWRCRRGDAVAAVGGTTLHRPISGKRAGAGRCEDCGGPDFGQPDSFGAENASGIDRITGQGFTGDGNDDASEQIAGVGAHQGSRSDGSAEPSVQR